MDIDNLKNVKLDYSQLLQRQLDRIAFTTSQNMKVDEKLTILKVEIDFLGAMIPKELLGEEEEKKEENNEDIDEEQDDKKKYKLIIDLLHKYINILADKGYLYQNRTNGTMEGEFTE